MAVTANSINPVSQLDQVLDRNASPGQKWFSLHNNKLDGTFKTLDAIAVEVDLTVNRNLLESIATYNYPARGTSEVINMNTIKFVPTDISGSTPYIFMKAIQGTVFDPALDYVYSLKLKSVAPATTDIIWRYGLRNSGSPDYSVTIAPGETVMVEVPFKYTGSSNPTLIVFTTQYTSNVAVEISEVKIEKGTTSTPWQPAIEDGVVWTKLQTSSEIGHWGNTLSNASGVFTTAQTLTMTYTDLQSLNTLRVAGDELLNEFPVDFTLKLFNAAALVHTETVTNNTGVHWKKALPQTIDADKVELSVTKINRPNSVVKIVEASELWELSRSDVAVIKSAESSFNGISITSADIARITSVDTSDDVSVSTKRTDAINIAPTDTSFFNRYEIWKKDSAIIKSVDTKDHPIVSAKRTDSVAIRGAEYDKITNSFRRTDIARLYQLPEDDQLTAELYVSDTGIITADELSRMTNIHTVMDAPYREIFGKVEITYTDPFLDADVQVVASSTAYPTSAQETTDTKAETDEKWFSLQDNKLDGTYHAMPDDLLYNSVGWWGATLSNASGVISPAETLEVSFTPRAVYDFLVTGDDKLVEYPVDFDIVLRNEVGTILHTESVVGNNQVKWSKVPAIPINDVATMTLVVYKVNKAYRTVKIVEFFKALTETYTNSELISIDLLEEQTFSDMTLPIGNVSANEIDVRISNFNRKFDHGNTSSPLYGWLKKNRKLKAWLGAEITPGIIEWYPLGVFWTQDWNAPDSATWASVTALDRLELLRLTNFNTSQVYINQNLYDIAQIIMNSAGLTIDDYVLDPALVNITVPYIWFNRISHREALVRVAQAALGRAYCDRLGRIVVSVFNTTERALYDFDYDKSIIDLDRPIALGQLTNSVEVHAKPRVLETAKEIYSSSEEIVLAPGEIYSETITFSNVPALNVEAPVITSGPDITVDNYTVYAWGMEVTFKNEGATSQTITNVSITGQLLIVEGQRVAVAEDARSILDNGKQAFKLENDFIQSYQKANVIAQDLLATYSNIRHDASIMSRGNVALTIGDRVGVPTLQGEIIDHFITRQNLSWQGSLDAKVDAQILV